VSVRTIEGHIYRACARVGAATRTDLARSLRNLRPHRRASDQRAATNIESFAHGVQGAPLLRAIAAVGQLEPCRAKHPPLPLYASRAPGVTTVAAPSRPVGAGCCPRQG